MKVRRIRAFFETMGRPRTNLGKTHPRNEEESSLTVKVRCPDCANLLTHINVGDYEVSVRRRFFCKKCKNTLLVLVNPAISRHAM